MIIDPQELYGNWREGFALDFHTKSSTPKYEIPNEETLGIKEITQSTPGRIIITMGKGLPSFKIIGWDTKRTEIGEQLYQLKYRQNRSAIQLIAPEVVNFLSTKTHWKIHKIIPIPPSDIARSFQPVYELAKSIGILRNLEVDLKTLKKIKPTSPLKNFEDDIQRKEILKDAFNTDNNSLIRKNILLFDDIFRSGDTLNAAYDTLKNKGNAANIYVLTITKTRSKQ